MPPPFKYTPRQAVLAFATYELYRIARGQVTPDVLEELSPSGLHKARLSAAKLHNTLAEQAPELGIDPIDTKSMSRLERNAS